MPGTLFSTASPNPHSNLPLGALSGEIRRSPTPPSAGEELPVAVVLPVDRVHHRSTRKDLPSTTVPPSSLISPWIVAGDRRKLSGAGKSFPLSLSFKPDAWGPRVSPSQLYPNRYSEAYSARVRFLFWVVYSGRNVFSFRRETPGQFPIHHRIVPGFKT